MRTFRGPFIILLLPAPQAGWFTQVAFFTAPPAAAGEEGKSGDTPETPSGAAPLHPAHKQPTRVTGRVAGPARHPHLSSDIISLDWELFKSAVPVLAGVDGDAPAPEIFAFRSRDSDDRGQNGPADSA